MKLIREVTINDVGTINTIYDGSASPVRGVTVDIAEHGSDPIAIRSGFTGNEATHLFCRPTASGGQVMSCGGPVMGPLVSIEWQGTLDLKRGVIRFWDEPIHPYGRPVLGIFEEAGVGAGSDAADWQVDYPGDWFNAHELYWYGTDNFRASMSLTKGNVAPQTPITVGESGAADQLGLWQASSVFDSLLVRFRNLGAAPADVWGTVVGSVLR